MNASRCLLLSGLLLTSLAGCQGGMPPRRAMTANEPGLDDGAKVVSNAGSPSWVDRHPLLYKPRDYYETSGDNKIVKTAAATVIGIPAGVVGELRQIVTGAPSNRR